MFRWICLLLLGVLMMRPESAFSGQMKKADKGLTANLTVQAGKDGPMVSPHLYGIFFEEINRAGEGGLWGEMLQNTSFEDEDKYPVAWTASASVATALDRSKPLHKNKPTSLKLVFPKDGGGVSNAGFSREKAKDRPAFAGGLALRKGEPLRLSLYQRGAVRLGARLENEGGKVLANAPLPAPGASWEKVEVILKPSATNLSGRLVLAGKGRGTDWIDQV